MQHVLIAGSLNMDFVVNVSRRPQAGETVFGDKFSRAPGGKGANQAYTLGKMGAETAMIGAVGADDDGQRMRENLQSVGVDTSGIAVLEGQDTGKAFIEVEPDGQNSIVVVAGANMKVTPAMIGQAEEWFQRCDAVVMQLEIPLESVLAAARLARRFGKKVILDPAPARKDLPAELFPLLDIIKPNETELEILTGIPADTPENIRKAGQQLLAKGVGQVIVTLGQQGSVLIEKDRMESVPARKVRAVDTTAAGDCYTAALICRLAEGNTIEAMRFASQAAAIAVTRRGAQASIPNLKEVEEYQNV